MLDNVRSPADVKALDAAALPELAEELRREIVAGVSKPGGHLASSPYAWKLLTGRREGFGTLRKFGGLSGFCCPEESDCDAFVSGHAGSALAAAEGMAAARDLRGSAEHVVAVVGDASLSNGESLEALNNCSQLKGKVILVLNDNEMSISKNVGSFARVLGKMISGVRYNRVKAAAERMGHKLRLTFLRGAYHRLESTLKSIWLGNAFFESFGLRYIGPVDGHDMKAVENALAVARDDKRSVVVHVVTVKGRGFAPAERNPTAWHGVGPFAMPEHGSPEKPAPSHGWSEAFGEALAAHARSDEKVCALTAAMCDGTGLAAFAREFPDRFFDGGICEEYLVTFAAGLAKAGMKPVVAIYSTFLQRAVDQVMHDVCLLNLPVVFAVDRAGCVGADGRTHHGMFDIAMLRCLPNMTICQPCDEGDMKEMLSLALKKGGPWAMRYPRGKAQDAAVPRVAVEYGKARAVSGEGAKVQLWALGDQVAKAVKVAAALKERGVEAGVVDARFVKPFDAKLLARHRAAGAFVASLENGSVMGGFGEAIGADMKFGWPDEFVGHGSAAELERAARFDVDSVAQAISGRIKGA